jgi:tetratricopeptide (TPR) repeat protein
LLSRAQSEITASKPFQWRLPREVQDLLERAEASFSQAIELLEDRDDDDSRTAAYGNRALCRSFLTRTSEALADYDQALSLDAGNPQLLCNKARLLLATNQAAAAVECFERVPSGAMAAETLVPKADAYLAVKEFRKAAQILEPLWSSANETTLKLDIADSLAVAYRKTGQLDKLRAVLETLQKEYSDDPDAICICAEQAAKDGQVAPQLTV